jgi:hypothetical protein
MRVVTCDYAYQQIHLQEEHHENLNILQRQRHICGHTAEWFINLNSTECRAAGNNSRGVGGMQDCGSLVAREIHSLVDLAPDHSRAIWNRFWFPKMLWKEEG